MTASPPFKRVPAEATPEMLGAWYRYKSGFHFPDEPPPADTSDVGAYRAMLAASPEPPAEEVETLRERVKELTAALYEIANRAGNMCDDDAADWLPSIYKIACDVTGENPEPLLEAYASYRARTKGNG